MAPAIWATGLLAGGVRGGDVKGIKPVGCEVTLQGGVNLVFVFFCGMRGRIGSRNRELRECRWTPSCWLHPKLTNYPAGFAQRKCTVNRMQWRGANARVATAMRQWAKCTAEIAWKGAMNIAMNRATARDWQNSSLRGPDKY